MAGSPFGVSRQPGQMETDRQQGHRVPAVQTLRPARLAGAAGRRQTQAGRPPGHIGPGPAAGASFAGAKSRSLRCQSMRSPERLPDAQQLLQQIVGNCVEAFRLGRLVPAGEQRPLGPVIRPGGWRRTVQVHHRPQPGRAQADAEFSDKVCHQSVADRLLADQGMLRPVDGQVTAREVVRRLRCPRPSRALLAPAVRARSRPPRTEPPARPG